MKESVITKQAPSLSDSHLHQQLKTLIYLSLFALSTMACALLQGPQKVVIPTPPPTLPGAVPVGNIPENAVIDPVSDVVLRVDPDISNLMNSVSQQQLLGYVQTLESFGTRHTFSAVDREGEGIGAARRWIFNEFIRVGNGRLLVEIDEFPLNYNGISYPQQNIVATLPGDSAYPGAIVISAHYDSRANDPFDGFSYAPGANDNGSGVALLLEMARIMSGRTWNQTIIFVATSGEEQGRYGSIHFVTERMLGGLQVDAALNNDIIGGHPGIAQNARVFAPGPLDSKPRQLARYIEFINGSYAPQFTVTWVDAEDRPDRWGDQMSFLQAGLPAVRIIESEENRDHQHNGLDTSEKLDYNYLRQVVQMNVAVAANIAGAPARPAAPTVMPTGEPGNFSITWAPDTTAAGYAISFRPVNVDAYPPFRFVNGRQAGNVVLTGLDPSTTYAVSIAALDGNGRISLFSPEVIAGQ